MCVCVCVCREGGRGEREDWLEGSIMGWTDKPRSTIQTGLGFFYFIYPASKKYVCTQPIIYRVSVLTTVLKCMG